MVSKEIIEEILTERLSTRDGREALMTYCIQPVRELLKKGAQLVKNPAYRWEPPEMPALLQDLVGKDDPIYEVWGLPEIRDQIDHVIPTLVRLREALDGTEMGPKYEFLCLFGDLQGMRDRLQGLR